MLLDFVEDLDVIVQIFDKIVLILPRRLDAPYFDLADKSSVFYGIYIQFSE